MLDIIWVIRGLPQRRFLGHGIKVTTLHSRGAADVFTYYLGAAVDLEQVFHELLDVMQRVRSGFRF